MSCLRVAVTAVLCFALAASSYAGNPQLIGNDSSGVLYAVDRGTGAATQPRPTGIQWLVGIAPGGVQGGIFGLTTFASSPPNSLVHINPDTGSWNLVGTTGLDDIFEGDLAVDPSTGRLYGVQWYEFATQLSYLFEIDPETGFATVIGPVPGLFGGDLSAMAFDQTGTLYIIDSDFELLLTIDPATADIVSSVSLSEPLGASAGMAFDPESGVLYVTDGSIDGTNTLYTLETATGILHAIGPVGTPEGLAGLTFLSGLFADGFESGDFSRWSAAVP